MKEPTKTYKITALSEIISPLTHMSGTSGNEAIVAREPVNTVYGVQWVPVISGNQIRHRLIREPAARWLIDLLDLKGELTREELLFWFHGGNLTKSAKSVKLSRQQELFRCFPLLRLIGCCLPDQIISGGLYVNRAILVCRENQSRIQRSVESWENIRREENSFFKSANHYVENYQYTRGEPRSSAPDICPDEELGKSNMMPFSGQWVIPGSLFLHGFILRHVSRVELGSLLHAITLWQSEGATLGGQSSRGHGQLESWFSLDSGDDFDSLIQEYLDYMDAVKDSAREFYLALFRPPKEVSGEDLEVSQLKEIVEKKAAKRKATKK